MPGLRGALFLVGAYLLTWSGASLAEDLAAARKLLDQGKTSVAYEQLTAFVKAHPRDGEGWFLLGRAAAATERLDEALTDYDKAVQLRPDLPEPYNNLAVIYAARGDDRSARDQLVTALNTHPSYATAYNNLTQLYAKMASDAYAKALTPSGEAAPVSGAVPLTALNQLYGVNEPAAAVAAAAPARSSTEVWAEAKRQVQETLQAWAQAWSKADVDRYLSFYSPQFVLTDGLSRVDWEAQRRARLTAPRFIEVKMRQLDVRLLDDSSLVLVNFDQLYRSDKVSDSVKKFMVLKRAGDHWLIVQEVTGS